MTIRVALHHRTVYKYDRPVTLSPHVIRLRPAPHARTPIDAYRLQVEPKPNFLTWQQDPLGNWQARVVFPELTDYFSVTVDLVAQMVALNPFDFFVSEEALKWPFKYLPELALELKPYLETLTACAKVDAWVATIPRKPVTTVDLLVELNQRLSKEISYLIRMEPGVQTPDETLTLGSGSCRDTAWLLVQILRRLGIAARFCSGYLVQLVADQKSLDGPSGTDKDFTDLHAWCEAYIPGAGWVGLDPTSGLLAGEGHIPLAATAEPQTAAAVSGSFSFSKKKDSDEKVSTSFDFAMQVTRIHEDPRVTKPYSAQEWNAIDALGHTIDEHFRKNDLRLTMGGEPTFVSIDDYDGAEWNTDALGVQKRERANELVRRLRQRFAPKAALHMGQGKWYPGEQLPRWAFTAVWRKDGEPVWRNDALIADERHPGGHTDTQAKAFIAALAERIGVPADNIMPWYEDTWYHLWRERRLPANVDPLDCKLEEPLERDRLAKIFRQGLEQVVGYTFPLACDYGIWRSGRWFVRDERLYLIPGDSPMGFRLPLDSLPWSVEADRDSEPPTDPSQPRGKLQVTPIKVQPPKPDRGVKKGVSATDIVRSALCVQPRDGILHIFMPPLPRAEDWLALVSIIEETAAALKLPVQLEGYNAPTDYRLSSFSVTPDPGVIEVNIHPQENWPALVETTRQLYEEARLTRLGTEKFMIDGRHTGTGGGNHVTLGGATPLESPFLRRTDLLASMVAYWHNHPSLSYLFSGLFIGATSQAPRADEARTEITYELETALRLAVPGQHQQPWLTDRLFRNLLVDMTGNTHRAEFSIDKLFTQDATSGRRGLVEMRAFEMPPHAEMSLAQLVLVRALVARFWDKPYRAPLTNWDMQLHDRWMLPWFVWDDFSEVCRELGEYGLPVDASWFAPHFEFRFPQLGSINHRALELELRTALEPWPVLGEESGGSGTVRYVDSSIERLQVRLRGSTDKRYVVTVNGRPLPLHPTGTAGDYVCGVRYRAWQPESCLHPTIGVHTPLVFDIVDTWNNRAVSGCTYHVVHPGGRAHDTRPVNANEAEGRRIARFQPFGFTPGERQVTPPRPDRDCPFTLDLRRG